MHDAGLPLPTQSTGGRARCFCGAEIDIASMSPHVNELTTLASRLVSRTVEHLASLL
jgi:hypothetical protein